MNDDQQAVADNIIADAIDAAEDIRDPLDGLVDKTTSDPGARTGNMDQSSVPINP